MNEQRLLDWAFYNIDGDTSKEGEVLKIALCQSYQQRYTDLKTMCFNAGLTDYQVELVRKWKQHGGQLDSYIFYTLYEHLIYNERERYLKSLCIYYKQNNLS